MVTGTRRSASSGSSRRGRRSPQRHRLAVDVHDARQDRVHLVVGQALPGEAVFPLHPRTARRLEEAGLRERLEAAIKVTPPLGYLEFMQLLWHARAVLTDSGGVQKEAYLLETPCITLRDTTEWVETVDAGWNVLVGLDIEAALRALDRPRPTGPRPELYGGGNAAERIRDVLDSYTHGR